MKYAAFLLLAVCAVARAQPCPPHVDCSPAGQLSTCTESGCLPIQSTLHDLHGVQCIIITTVPPTLECDGKQVPVVIKASPIGDGVDRSWHLMSVTYGGTVTLLKGLTHHEAEFMYDRLMGLPATEAEKAKAAKDAAASDAQMKAAVDACNFCSKSRQWQIFKRANDVNDETDWDCYDVYGTSKHEVGLGGGGIGISSSSPVDRSGDIKSAEIFQ